MPRVVVYLGGLVLALLVASQLVLPELAERQAESRLEEGGGHAKVEVTAFPAPRLLFGDGDRFEAEGRGLSVDVGRKGGDLGRLDGFGEVRVHLTTVSAGPLDVRDFVLTRRNGAPAYDLRMSAITTPRDVAGFLGSQAGGALGGLFGDLAAGSLPGGGRTRVPLAVTAQVESRNGRPLVDAADGSVAGIPAGPLAQLVVAAVVARI
jgi:hypothetical protein